MEACCRGGWIGAGGVVRHLSDPDSHRCTEYSNLGTDAAAAFAVHDPTTTMAASQMARNACDLKLNPRFNPVSPAPILGRGRDASEIASETRRFGSGSGQPRASASLSPTSRRRHPSLCEASRASRIARRSACVAIECELVSAYPGTRPLACRVRVSCCVVGCGLRAPRLARGSCPHR
jgi:hypothetical protein